LLPDIRKIFGSPLVRYSVKLIQRMQNMLVYRFCVSQSSVVTRFGCGRKFNNSFVANCLRNVLIEIVKKFVEN